MRCAPYYAFANDAYSTLTINEVFANTRDMLLIAIGGITPDDFIVGQRSVIQVDGQPILFGNNNYLQFQPASPRNVWVELWNSPIPPWSTNGLHTINVIQTAYSGPRAMAVYVFPMGFNVWMSQIWAFDHTRDMTLGYDGWSSSGGVIYPQDPEKLNYFVDPPPHGIPAETKARYGMHVHFAGSTQLATSAADFQTGTWTNGFSMAGYCTAVGPINVRNDANYTVSLTQPGFILRTGFKQEYMPTEEQTQLTGLAPQYTATTGYTTRLEWRPLYDYWSFIP